MIETIIIGTFCIFIVHWIADYLLQRGEWAIQKSSDMNALLKHTITYSVVWLIPMIPLLGFINALWFCYLTWVIHTLTDFATSPKVKRMFEEEKYYTDLPNQGVFSMMGFDQVLHYLQLYGTFLFLLL